MSMLPWCLNLLPYTLLGAHRLKSSSTCTAFDRWRALVAHMEPICCRTLPWTSEAPPTVTNRSMTGYSKCHLTQVSLEWKGSWVNTSEIVRPAAVTPRPAIETVSCPCETGWLCEGMLTIGGGRCDLEPGVKSTAEQLQFLWLPIMGTCP